MPPGGGQGHFRVVGGKAAEDPVGPSLEDRRLSSTLRRGRQPRRNDGDRGSPFGLAVGGWAGGPPQCCRSSSRFQKRRARDGIGGVEN